MNVTYTVMLMYTNLLYLVFIAAASLSSSVIEHMGGSCSDDQRMCDDGSCISVDEECQNSGVPPRTPRRQTRQVEAGTCVLPEYPAHGTYSAHTHAHDVLVVNVTCSAGFTLSGSAIVFCNRGWWLRPMPTCVSHCHLPSDPSVIYYCRDFGRVESSRDCNSYEMNGTVVRPQCRRPYYYSGGALADMLCVDGNWNYTAKCSPECGEVSSIGDSLIIDGKSAERAEVPWHAGVYTRTTRPYKQICGGTLISNNIVISAAHCFWSNLENEQLPAAEFAVAVGKLYRPWVNGNDEYSAQKSNVSALHLPALFQGSMANNQEDLAVVVVATRFQFTSFVQPACLDFDFIFQKTQLKVGNMGKVAGWGLTSENGRHSAVLKVTELPVVSAERCLRDSPPDFRGYITPDKFCAGFLNERKGVCMGDSGGGLAFPEYSDQGTPRYYLRGVVSSAPTSDDRLCNANFYTTFTQILKHEHFIKQYWISEGSRHDRFNKEFWKTGEFTCKEESFNTSRRLTPRYSMDNESLNHVALRDSAGRLAYFELHFAVQADRRVDVYLWDSADVETSQVRYFIRIGDDGNQYTYLIDDKKVFQTIRHVHTPDILSPTQFRTFYIKIDDGKLEFGKEGDSRLLLSHYDVRVTAIGYFGFSYGWYNAATVRFDCPHPAPTPPRPRPHPAPTPAPRRA